MRFALPSSRRPGSQLSAATLCAVFAFFSVGAGWGTGTESTARGEVIEPRAADAFVDSVGVNIHLHYTDRPAYWHFDGYRDLLIESGIRHVRDGFVQGGREEYYGRHEVLENAGIRGTFIASPRRGFNGIEAAKVIPELDRLGGYIAAVESANEWDISKDKDAPGGWAMPLAQYHADLHAAVKNSPEHGHLPLLAPSLVRHASHAEAAVAYQAVNARPLSGDVDFGNMHPYPGGRMPSHEVDNKLQDIVPISGDKPVMATETGYHNALMATGHAGVSEEAAAGYTPRLYFEYFNRGIVRTFDYELVDNYNESGSNGGSSGTGEGSGDREAHFGLIAYDPETDTHTAKPAYHALKNTLTLLADPHPDPHTAPHPAPDRPASQAETGDGGDEPGEPGEEPGAWQPTPLDLTLTGGGDELRHTLLQRRDGSYALVLWRDVPLWDVNAGEALTPEAATVTVALGEEASGITLYHPTQAAEAIAELEDAASFDLSVGGEVVIVQFATGGEVPEPASLGLMGVMGAAGLLLLRRRSPRDMEA